MQIFTTYILKHIFLGVVVAQAIGSVHVWLSNRELYHTCLCLNQSGYLAIPNHMILSGLLDIRPALAGGLFFSLSLGTSMTLLGLGAALFRDRFLTHHKGWLFFLPWSLLVWVVNQKGFHIFATLYVTIIPGLVYLSAASTVPQPPARAWILTVFCFFPPIIIMLMAIPELKSSFFLDVRDRILLPNRYGQAITDFY